MLRRFPRAVVVMEVHLRRDPQTVSLLHQIEQAGRPLRSINYEGDVVVASINTNLA